MPSPFHREKPLQAGKLAAVVCVVAFGIAGFVGVLPGQQLNSVLFLAFFPMLLAIVVGAETLLAAIRLARADDPVARLTAHRGYTAIRAIEFLVTVIAPGTFYVLIVRLGSEVAGPGAIGLLFVGIVLGLCAYAAVVLRTLTEYYYHRRRSASTRVDDPGGRVPE